MDFTSFVLSLFLAGDPQTAATGGSATTTMQAAPSAEQIVDRVQAFYVSTAKYTALFRQTVVNNTFGKTNQSDGKVYIKKPGKMRWDYFSKKNKDKVAKSFMSDGETLWAVFIDDLTFYKKPLKDDVLPVAVSFLSGTGDLKKDFTVALDTESRYGDKSDYVIKLLPKQPSAQYKTLWLVVDPGNYRVKQSVVLNSNNDTSTFAFYSPDVKKDVADSWFVYNESKNKKSGFREIKPEQGSASE